MKLQALTINTFYNSVLNMKESLLIQKLLQKAKVHKLP